MRRLREYLFRAAGCAHGREAGDKFRAARSLPALLVVGSDGVEIDRMEGFGDKASFLTWLDDRARVALGGPLTNERLANEKDPLALLLGGRLAERANETDRARHLYGAARDADPKDARGIGSKASLDLLHLRARDDTARDHGALLLAFVKAYPASSLALQALGGLATLPASARPPTADIQRAVRAVRAASPGPNDWLAQIEHTLGLSNASPPPGSSLPPGARFPPPTDPIADAPPPGADDDSAIPPDIKAMFDRDMTFGTKVGRICKDAPRPAGTKEAWVRVRIKDGAVRRALLLDPEADPALKACIEGEASKQRDLGPLYGDVHVWEIRFAATAKSE